MTDPGYPSPSEGQGATPVKNPKPPSDKPENAEADPSHVDKEPNKNQYSGGGAIK